MSNFQTDLMKSLFQHTNTSVIIDNVKLRNMIAIWIVNCQRSLSIIEDPELIQILQYLNPTAELVKADAIKKTVMSLYGLGKQELKVAL